jgi:hypothetical protein
MIRDLWICVDCLFVVANGVETPDQAKAADAMAVRWPEHIIVPAAQEDEEPHFSWSSCDGCGSSLGGDRERAAALTRG